MNASEIAAWVALVFASISLYWQYQSRQSHLDVTPHIELRILNATTWTGEQSVLTAYLSNPREKPVYIKEICLIIRDERIQLFITHSIYPKHWASIVIDPLRGYEFIANPQTLFDDLEAKKIEGVFDAVVRVYDETQKQHDSEMFQLDTANLRRPVSETQPE